MRLRCPSCEAVNEFEDDEPMVCRSCGWSDPDAAAEPQVPTQASPLSAPAPSPQPPAGPHGAPGTHGDGSGPSNGHPDNALPVQRPVDPVSVTSMVLGILALLGGFTFFLILPLAALITGIIGVSRTGPHDAFGGRGFALTGAILGIVTLIFGGIFFMFARLFFGGAPWWTGGF